MRADPSAPPLPARALRVGVVGHRDLHGTDLARLRAALARLLATTRDAVLETRGALGLDDGAPPRLVLVSALAAGVDQLGAEEGLRLGYELHAPLPFLAEDYARDFASDPEAAAAFESLRARATRVFEVGARREGAAAGEASRAYLAVGRLVLTNCDLLVAVWDGAPSRGAGGTGDVVAEALAARVPVLLVPPQSPETVELRVCAGEAAACAGGEAALPELVRRLLAPFGAEGPGAPSGPDAALLAHQRARFEAYLGEASPTSRAAPRRWLRAILVGAWRGFVRLVTGGRLPRSAAPPAEAPGEGTGAAAHAAWAEALAQYYVHLYRGAFLVNYLLGALAVTMAIFSLAGVGGGAAHHASALWPLVELGALLGIALVYAWGRTGRWHERGVNYRVLAELFRQDRHLAPLGLGVPATRPRAHVHGEADLNLAWMVAHYRAVTRARGLCAARFAPGVPARARDALVGDWLDEQAAYHRATALRLGRAERRLERLALGLFGGAALACALHFLLGEVWHGALAAIAAGLPAWAAALHGILGQAEWTRLAERSEAMAHRLGELSARLAALPAETLAWREVADAARDASLAMLLELDDWQVLSRAGDVPAP